MLSQGEISALYKIISDDNQVFEKISESFNNNFKNENKTKVGTTLLFLLKNNLLNISQRIISYYLLYEISKDQNAETNPYIPIILEMLKKSQNKNEQNFLIDFLYNQIHYLNITVQNYLNDNSRERNVNLNQIILQWDNYFKTVLNKNNINLKKDDKIRPIIYDRKKRDVINIDNHQNNNLSMNDDNNTIEKGFNLNYFNPNYMSYHPMNNKFINSEPIWLLPSLNHNFIWDSKNNNN